MSEVPNSVKKYTKYYKLVYNIINYTVYIFQVTRQRQISEYKLEDNEGKQTFPIPQTPKRGRTR